MVVQLRKERGERFIDGKNHLSLRPSGTPLRLCGKKPALLFHIAFLAGIAYVLLHPKRSYYFQSDEARERFFTGHNWQPDNSFR